MSAFYGAALRMYDEATGRTGIHVFNGVSLSVMLNAFTRLKEPDGGACVHAWLCVLLNLRVLYGSVKS
jgi:hypothetical protein